MSLEVDSSQSQSELDAPLWATHPHEFVNSITHALGLLLSLCAVVYLSIQAHIHASLPVAIACDLYGISLVLVYAASTMSHLIQEPLRKRFYRRLDQGFIYLLIAGTYMPFPIAFLPWGIWWILPALTWLIALGGCYSKIFRAYRIESVETGVYIFLGWLPVLTVYPLWGKLPMTALLLMIAGGFSYMLGTVFLVLDGRNPYYHGIWHLLVIAGSLFHYFAILLFIAMPVT